MMSLGKYRSRADLLSDFLPWAALVEKGVVLNKDGSFQRTAKIRGPDLDSATPAELVGVTGRLNNALRRLGSGWAVFVEAQRVPATLYPEGDFPDAASQMVDLERREQFEDEGAHFESRYFLTLVWLPPAESFGRAERFLYEGRERDGPDPYGMLHSFIDRTDRMLVLLDGFMPEAAWLDDGETLTYLHSTISTRNQRVRVPEIPMHLDALLVDQPLAGGLEPKLGDAYLRTLTITGFPSRTFPGILDDLNRLAMPYRWSTRAILLDKTDATKVLTKIRRQWFAKRKSIAAIVREVMTNEASVLVDNDAVNKAADADLALQSLGADDVGQAYITATVTVWDGSASLAAEKLRLVEKIIQGHDFTCMTESLNAVEAWLGSLPGHVYANVRQPPVSTLIRMVMRAVPLALLILSGCAGQYHSPVIRYDDAVQAVRLPDPPKPVQVVEVPRILPLPGQLKPLSSRHTVHPAPEVADPTARVTQANLAARIQPTRAGFINAVQVYPYSAGALYQVYASPGEITDIMLQQGEKLVGTGPVAAGDTVRWIIGDTESGAGGTKRIHILLKPTRPDLTTNLIVNTDRRTYLAELRSTPATYMASVSWDYPEDDLIALHRQDDAADDAAPVDAGLNLAALNFRYAIQPVKGGTPPWLPSRAFDDGHKVYIAFPSGIGQGELPPLFVLGADGGPELVNYRVRQNWMIVDRLFAAAELRLGDKHSEQRVRIVRTDGRPS